METVIVHGHFLQKRTRVVASWKNKCPNVVLIAPERSSQVTIE